MRNDSPTYYRKEKDRNKMIELIRIDWELESFRHSMWNYLQDMIEKAKGRK